MFESFLYPPHLLIHQKKSVFSGLGLIIFIILIFGLSILICLDKGMEFFQKGNPNIIEKSYTVTDEFCPNISIDEKFSFSFSVKSVDEQNKDNFLDRTYFTPRLFLYLVNSDDNEYKNAIADYTFKNYSNIKGKPFFKISNLFNYTNASITICSGYRTHLKLHLKPCEDEDLKDTELKCQLPSKIYKALEKVKVYIKLQSDISSYEKEIQNYLKIYETEVYDRNKASILGRTEVDYFFEHVETEINSPYFFLNIIIIIFFM